MGHTQLHSRRVRHPERRHVEDALGRRHARRLQPGQLAAGLHGGRERQLPPVRRPDLRRGHGAAESGEHRELRGGDRQAPSISSRFDRRPRRVLRADAGRSELPFQLADPVHRVAPQRAHYLLWRQPPVQVRRWGRDVADHQPRPFEQRPGDHPAGYRRPDARLDRGGNARHHRLALGIATGPGARVGGNRRWQRVGDERRRLVVDEGQRPDSGRPGEVMGERRRGVGPRARHGLRLFRRPPQRRLRHMGLQDDGLRSHLDQHRPDAAAESTGARPDGRRQESGAHLRGNRVRRPRHAGRRRLVAAADERDANSRRARSGDTPARQ